MSASLLRRIILPKRSTLRQSQPKLGPFRRITTGQPQKSRSWRPFVTISSVAVASLSAYTLGAVFPPTPLSILFPRAAPAPPDPTSSESIAYTEALEAQLQRLPLLQTLRQRGDADEWYETRPYQNFPEERRVNSLTSGALRGPGKLALPGLVRARKDESESLAFVHVGRGLCGHDGIIHGGLLATLLDEALGRIALVNLPEKVGMTATLSLNYRAPTRADQFIVIKTFLNEAKGRKCVVAGRIEDLDGTVLVEATALFVQPRFAKMLNTKAIKQAMGEPPESDAPVHLADGEKLQSKAK